MAIFNIYVRLPGFFSWNHHGMEDNPNARCWQICQHLPYCKRPSFVARYSSTMVRMWVWIGVRRWFLLEDQWNGTIMEYNSGLYVVLSEAMQKYNKLEYIGSS